MTHDAPAPQPPALTLGQVDTSGSCGCHACQAEAAKVRRPPDGRGYFCGPFVFRYACEICGNKRCPHHTDHALACTASNASGQPGSLYQ